MKTHTNNFKNNLIKFGREIDSKITYTQNGTQVELGSEELNSITPHYEGGILKSVMRQLDIDSNVEIPLGTILTYQFGVKVGNQYEYINFGNYIVYKAEKQEDTDSWQITCYDKMLYAMKDYEALNITYPITIRDYITAICNKIGLTFKYSSSGTFANYNKTIPNELYLDEDGKTLGYTYRDVLDELAQVTASTICINENDDELEIRYINNTNDTIDEEFLKDVNVNFGERYGPVNTIVLSRSAGADNIYYPSTLPSNPIEIKISDNQILNGNNRDEFIVNIYNKLNGLEYYINDFSSTGICYYNLCDRYNVSIGDNTYSCVMFNDEINVTQGLEENVYTEMPEDAETDYKKSDTTDRRINQTTLIVDKQQQEITALVDTTEDIQKEINPTKDTSGSSIYLEDSTNAELVNFEMEGKTTQETREGYNLVSISDQFRAGSAAANITPSVNSNGELQVVVTASNGNWHTNWWDSNQSFTNIENTLATGDTFTIVFTIKKSSDSNGGKPIIYIKSGMGYYTMTGTVGTEYSELYYTGTWNDTNGIAFHLGWGSCVGTYTIKNWMLKKGTYKSYEPYGVMPSPDYPSELVSVGTYITETGKYGIEVVSQGSNFFDATKIANTSINVSQDGKEIVMPVATSGNGITGAGATLKQLAPNLKVGDRVYLLATRTPSTYNRYIYLHGSSSLWNFGNSRTITQQDLNGNVSFYANRYSDGETSQVVITDFRIVKVQNTAWEEYKDKTYLYTLNQPLRSIGDTKDLLYIKNGMLYVDRKIGSVVLDGSESGWYIGNSGNTGNIKRFVLSLSASLPNQSYDLKSNYFVGGMPYSSNVEGVNINSSSLLSIYKDENDLASFKTWLSTHNTEVQYILAEPNTEGLGKIEVPNTYKTTTHIDTIDINEPNMNITYVRDTQLTNYVEEHISQIIVNEEGISSRVQTIEDSDYDSRLNAVEQKQTDTDLTIDIISTNIDKTNGNIREVTTTTGFTFNAEGMTIEDSSSQFKAQHRVDGTYYKDGDTIVGQYTKDGSKQKDLSLFGVYYYGMNDIDDTPMFVAQLYTDNNGEEGFGHFPNRSD